MAKALQGIKVLDFTQALGGPACTCILKEMGAEVIKVERPRTGDMNRTAPPLTDGGVSATFIFRNRGKKSITVINPDGQDVKKLELMVQYLDGEHKYHIFTPLDANGTATVDLPGDVLILQSGIVDVNDLHKPTDVTYFASSRTPIEASSAHYAGSNVQNSSTPNSEY